MSVRVARATTTSRVFSAFGLVAVAVFVPLGFFGSSQTLWSAIYLAMRPLEPNDDVDLRWIPTSRSDPRGGRSR